MPYGIMKPAERKRKGVIQWRNPVFGRCSGPTSVPCGTRFLAVGQYSAWRSDVSRTEVRGERQFVEYTKDGYATAFTVTLVEPYQRWAFTMENTNMTGQ